MCYNRAYDIVSLPRLPAELVVVDSGGMSQSKVVPKSRRVVFHSGIVWKMSVDYLGESRGESLSGDPVHLFITTIRHLLG